MIRECIDLGKPGIARAVGLGRYTGARRGDIVKMAKSARRGRRIAWLSGKKRVPVDQPEAPELTNWLKATPDHHPLSRWQKNTDRRTGVTRLPSRTLVYNRSDSPYAEDGLGQELAQIVQMLHGEGDIDRAEYTLHGLRHSVGVELALVGATDAQGAAWLGHASPHSFAIYRRQANRMLLTNTAGDLISDLRARSGGTASERQVQNECKKVQNSDGKVIRLRR